MKLNLKYLVPLMVCAVVTGCYRNATNTNLNKINDVSANGKYISRSAEQTASINKNIARNPWFAESREGRNILAAMARGDPYALANYSRLYDTPNAEWSEDLDMALAEALQRNPMGVLAMADTPEKFDRFCTVPFIEPTDEVVRTYLRAALKALGAIASDSPLAARRDACARRLQGMLDEVDKSKGR